MSQEQFSQFMAEQMQAIEESGMDPEQWIEQNSEAFRQQWEDSHAEV